MKPFLLSFLMFFLISCQNIRHVTNINLQDLKALNYDRKRQKELDQKIKTISNQEAESCSLIKKFETKDNIVDQGEKFAILYLKLEADYVDGNAVVIDKIEKVGDYGSVVYGRIFKCP